MSPKKPDGELEALRRATVAIMSQPIEAWQRMLDYLDQRITGEMKRRAARHPEDEESS